MNYSINIKLNDHVTKVLKGITASLKKIRDIDITPKVNTSTIKNTLNNIKATVGISTTLKNISRVKQQIYDVGKGMVTKIKLKIDNLPTIKQQLQNLKSIALSLIPIFASLFMPVLEAIKFEKNFVAVKKLFKGSKEELEQFRQKLMQISSATPTTLKDLTIISSAGLQSGISTKEVQAYTELVAKASVAFDMTADTIGTAFGKIRVQLKYSVDDLKEFSDIVNHVADNTASSAKEILNVVQRTAGSLGDFSKTDVVSMASIAIQYTNSPEIAGSATNSIINSMKKNVKGALSGLEKEGMQFYVDFLEKIAKLDSKAQYAKLRDVFGVGESLSLVQKSIRNLENVKLTMDISASKEALGSMEREFKNVISTVSARWDIFKNKISIVMIRIGEIIMPIVSRILNHFNSMLDGINNWVKNNRELTATLLRIAGVVGVVLVTLLGFKLVILGISGVMLLLSGTIGAISLPILAVVATLGVLYTYWGEVTTFLSSSWESFKIGFEQGVGTENYKILKTILRGIGEVFSWVGTVFRIVGDIINTVFRTNRESVKGVKQEIGLLQIIIESFGQAVGIVFNIIITVVRVLFSIIKTIGVFIATTFTIIWQTAFSIISGVINTFHIILNNIRVFISTLFVGAFNSAFNFINNIISGVSSRLRTMRGYITSIIKYISKIKVPSIKGMGNSISKGFKSVSNYVFGEDEIKRDRTDINVRVSAEKGSIAKVKAPIKSSRVNVR